MASVCRLQLNAHHVTPAVERHLVRLLKVGFVEHLNALCASTRAALASYLKKQSWQGFQKIECAPDVRVEGKAAEGAGAVALGQATRVDDQRPAHNAIRNE